MQTLETIAAAKALGINSPEVLKNLDAAATAASTTYADDHRIRSSVIKVAGQPVSPRVEIGLVQVLDKSDGDQTDAPKLLGPSTE